MLFIVFFILDPHLVTIVKTLQIWSRPNKYDRIWFCHVQPDIRPHTYICSYIHIQYPSYCNNCQVHALHSPSIVFDQICPLNPDIQLLIDVSIHFKSLQLLSQYQMLLQHGTKHSLKTKALNSSNDVLSRGLFHFSKGHPYKSVFFIGFTSVPKVPTPNQTCFEESPPNTRELNISSCLWEIISTFRS